MICGFIGLTCGRRRGRDVVAQYIGFKVKFAILVFFVNELTAYKTQVMFPGSINDKIANILV